MLKNNFYDFIKHDFGATYFKRLFQKKDINNQYMILELTTNNNNSNNNMYSLT